MFFLSVFADTFMLLTRHHLRFKGAPLSICVCTAKHVCLSSPCVALRLEAHTKAAADAVEEAKQKAIKRQEDIDRLQAEYDQELVPLLQAKDSVTHLQKSLSDAFQALSGCVEAQPLLSQMESAFTGLSGMLAAATPTPVATDERNDDIDTQPDEWLTVEAVARAHTRPRSRSSWSTASQNAGFGHLERHFNTTTCACPQLSSLAKILVGEGLPVRQSHQKTTWTITTANITAWKSGQLMLDTIPHSDFWALQETHLPGIEYMEAAQRWVRKRGWAASFQGAEVVGQHNAANRGGVAIAVPQHISTSVPTEFESMLEEAAVLALEGVVQPLQYLAKRTLARHTHAMLKGGATLVTVYLEPGMRASWLNLRLSEVLSGCVLCFDGAWIAM